MAHVQAIHVSAIKSLRLRSVPDAVISAEGIAFDREFLLLDDRGRVMTQREQGVLAQLESTYDGTTLTMTLPDGQKLAATPTTNGQTTTTELWGRPIEGDVVAGPWAAAVSELTGRRVDLVRPRAAERGLDSHAVSLVSQAAVDGLKAHAGRNGDFDARRFRPTLLITDCPAHIEDEWIGRRIRAGQAVLTGVRFDPRCSLTTRNPDTGERDADTLRWIDQMRGRVEGEVCFGIYADVVTPGAVAVGDTVEPIEQEAA